MPRRLAVIAALALAGAPVVALAGAVPAEAGGGCHRAATSALLDTKGDTVVMQRNCFTPAVLRVAPGTAVTFQNQDEIGHNVSMPADFNDVGPGQAIQLRFSDEGTFPFSCTLHPGMIGTVVVGDGDGVGTGAGAGDRSVTPDTALAASRQQGTDGGAGGWVGAVVGAGLIMGAAGFGFGRRTRQPAPIA